MKKVSHPLNNPVWSSLTQHHQAISISYEDIKFYNPDYCTFGGSATEKDITSQVMAYSVLADSFYIVGDKPALSNVLEIKKELVCLQMIIGNKIDYKNNENIRPLDADNFKALFELVDLVQPGYFRKKTALLGNYYGIFNNGALIAAAGERMQMNDFIEVSAVVTHPAHTRKGLAKQLTAHVVNNIFSQRKTPFLHVLESNLSAIGLYKKLGFTTRRVISFWQIAS